MRMGAIRCPVYPRPRGEYLVAPLYPTPLTGLPPPTRGIPRRHTHDNQCRRSTPAHAGNTIAIAPHFRFCAVYPRPRGEYLCRAIAHQIARGLPPPTRGIPCRRIKVVQRIRSTPAHAGNTIVAPEHYLVPAVYPRPRGEYRLRGKEGLPFLGLPPPTRGIRPRIRIDIGLLRSTPAHAGNTFRLRLRPPNPPVYPRPRGEYRCAGGDSHREDGLPPPTRGIPAP